MGLGAGAAREARGKYVGSGIVLDVHIHFLSFSAYVYLGLVCKKTVLDREERPPFLVGQSTPRGSRNINK